MVAGKQKALWRRSTLRFLNAAYITSFPSPAGHLSRPGTSAAASKTELSIVSMDISIQHPWFRRALGSAYPTRLFDQFFGEGMFDYDLFPYTASTISPYYRQSLFRSFFDFSNSGISEVNLWFYVGLRLFRCQTKEC